MVKISILGDIMCEGSLLEGSKGDFSRLFSNIRQLIENSDFVIGNLETPLAGEKLGYTVTKEMYSFNTPASFADAIKDFGIDLVLTANNHCCDRGITGIYKTLETLDQKGIAHNGTYRGSYNPYIIDIKGIRIAVISCTASTNSLRTHIKATNDYVNLLDEQILRKKGVKYYVKYKLIGEYNILALKKKIGLSPKKPYTDNEYSEERVKPYLNRICGQIIDAKKKADFVIVCPHMGGQFNETPGLFSENVMHVFTTAGADLVAASHPHVIQKIEYVNDVPCAFSLGNVSMSMSSMYMIPDGMPNYGMILHVYLEKDRLKELTFSLIEIREHKNGNLEVVPVEDLSVIRMLANRIFPKTSIGSDFEVHIYK